ncbi:hypothetical protein BLA24_16140 [Streptomyces cinnamoneus]|uniref:Uncharacterized protein n=1 Tax=Streptomyces cinnamoneus TaxID=53446 RepID=A0A2G1XJ74_STRCJ|nr:FAD/NAD(P)-binding oxidoreductase [Streptomyces cinnamoneus]PHQ51275.1 hypothetical protein BLA24_16140 [Streptomyces cinnamoneus]PPT13500.1 FAD-dependent oxidoreductase [Streptomyces cinnamoneus]
MSAAPRLVVVGAGPAGVAAALAAARGGVRVVLVDSAARAGGQYHLQPPPAGRHYRANPLQRAVTAHPRVEHLPHATVWSLEPGPPPAGHLVLLQQGPADAAGRGVRALAADGLVLCTGTHDRVLPFPGWDLPGVVSAGAARALAKGQRTAVGRRVVVAGTGPFLPPVAASLLGVGARVVGVYEAGRPASWLRSPVVALRDGGPDKLAELAAHTTGLTRHGIAYRTRRAVVAAHGGDRLEAVTVARVDARWRIVDGTERVVEPVDALCVGHGFLPQLELALAAGCAVRDGRVLVGPRQQTSVRRVYAAGDLTGSGGAAAAAAEGELAGLTAAADLTGRPADPARTMAAEARARAGRRFAAALAATYPVGDGWRTWLREDTVVCRCEEVTYGQLREAVVGRGADGARALGLACGAGLGACQGRMCGRAVADLAAGLLGHPLAEADALDRRPLGHPVRLADLAGLADDSSRRPPVD